jgi:hypothetical protein
MKSAYFPHFFFEYQDMLHSSQYFSTLGPMTAPGIHNLSSMEGQFYKKKYAYMYIFDYL